MVIIEEINDSHTLSGIDLTSELMYLSNTLIQFVNLIKTAVYSMDFMFKAANICLSFSKIEINNCYSIEKIFLRFEQKYFATIFNCPLSHKLKGKVLAAIQPFLLKESAKTPLECNAGVFRKNSNVRIKFIIPKGKFKNNVCVDASRIAQKPDHVYYYFNGEQFIDHIQVFHERCRIDVTPLFPCLNRVFSNEKRNLMSIWIENECSSLKYDREKSYELLANYVLISNIRPEAEVQNIGKIRNSILTLNRHTDLMEKQTFIDVANKTGQLFNYITFGKYVVQFRIPLTGQQIRMEEVKWGDMDFSNAETYVENIDGKFSMLWNKMEEGLKYLLKIAQMIALAKHLGQYCIIINDTNLLRNYQNQEMIKETIIEDDGTNNGANWKNKNFLNQIVNVCNDLKIMIFLNYHGGLLLPPENANILKCIEPNEFPEQQPIYVSTQSEQMTLEDFMRIIKPVTRMETT